MPASQPLVLVVDDDLRMLHMIKRLLALEGFRTLAASSGDAALKMLDDETPDLVLLDIIMPGIDGYAVCRRIREFSAVPIIMVTARDGSGEKAMGLELGADDYVTKPFSASELAARIRAILRRVDGRERPGTGAVMATAR
jgi:DNA-binding response OmpR family regulator